MVLGYSNFFEFNESDRATYRASLETMPIAKLRQLELEKTRALISSGLTVFSGAIASGPTSGLSLGWSGVGWRKWHVAYRKRQMLQARLLRHNQAPHHTDSKDVVLGGGAWATGMVIGGGLVDVGVGQLGGGASVAGTAGVAGGDLAGSAAKVTAEQASQALHGDAGVKDGFENGKELVPAMQEELVSSIEDSKVPGLGYLITDAGLHDIGNLGSASIGSTGAFVLKEGGQEVVAEGVLKSYSHAFEADKATTTTCRTAAKPQTDHL